MLQRTWMSLGMNTATSPVEYSFSRAPAVSWFPRAKPQGARQVPARGAFRAQFQPFSIRLRIYTQDHGASLINTPLQRGGGAGEVEGTVSTVSSRCQVSPYRSTN